MKCILVDPGWVLLQKINKAKFSAWWCLRLSNILSPTPLLGRISLIIIYPIILLIILYQMFIKITANKLLGKERNVALLLCLPRTHTTSIRASSTGVIHFLLKFQVSLDWSCNSVQHFWLSQPIQIWTFKQVLRKMFGAWSLRK